MTMTQWSAHTSGVPAGSTNRDSRRFFVPSGRCQAQERACQAFCAQPGLFQLLAKKLAMMRVRANQWLERVR